MKPPTSAKAAQGDAAPWSSFTDDDLDLPAELRSPLDVRTYRKMRIDPQVTSLLKATWMPISRTQARIDAAGCRDEVAHHVALNLGLPLVGQEEAPRPLRTRDRFSWSQHLRHVMLQDVYGYSAFEQVYRFNERSGRYDIRKLLWIPPWTVSEIKTASDGGLVQVRQDLPGTQPVPVSELVWHANEREGANWRGLSLLRSCYRPWLLKDRLQRVGVLSVERNGMGVPTYTAPPRDFTDDPDGVKAEADIAAGLSIAKGVRSGEAAGASLANGAKLELQGVTGSLPDATVFIRYFDEQMARAFLGHFLNLGTETGSWALGSTFADFFTLSLQAKAEEIADVTTQHVIEDLVDVNFGPDEPAPRLVFDEIGSQSAVTVEALKSLHDAGLLDEDEVLKQFIRVKFKLPKPSTSTHASEGARTLSAAEVSQKVYLAKVNGVLGTRESRQMIADAGGPIDPDLDPGADPAPLPKPSTTAPAPTEGVPSA